MSSLLVEKRGHTAIITMNNPPANTWTPESLKLLQDIVGTTCVVIIVDMNPKPSIKNSFDQI